MQVINSSEHVLDPQARNRQRNCRLLLKKAINVDEASFHDEHCINGNKSDQFEIKTQEFYYVLWYVLKPVKSAVTPRS